MTQTTRHCPALFISAPASGQGKTTVTAALARLQRQRGRTVRVFKTGPDFLDPMILEQASGHPVYQLDLWMGGEDHCRALLYHAAAHADLILIEGVMGLFDGECSSADLATLFDIPVMTVIDGRAMAQTFGALAHGLASYRPNLPFAGVFANRIASERHYGMLAESLPQSLTALGWLKRNDDIALPERHLGLLQADEINDLNARIDCAAQTLQNLPESLSTALPEPVAFKPTTDKVSSLNAPLKGVRIAVARDAAFAFLYPANVDCLQALGATLHFFSPLTDTDLPNADALYLTGGYPELHLDTLSHNHAMHEAIRAHHAQNKPIVAECGGMVYLGESLSDAQGHQASMIGLLQGQTTLQKRLVNLGMHSVELPEGLMRGHTYHYSKFDSPLTPMALSKGLRAGRQGEAFYRNGRLHASYFHHYFPSNPQLTVQLFTP